MRIITRTPVAFNGIGVGSFFEPIGVHPSNIPALEMTPVLLTRIRDKFLAPSRWVHGLLNAVAAFVALEVAEAILARNQSNGVYPADGDSIGIPLMGMMLSSIVALVFLLIGMLLVRRGVVARWSGYLLMVLVALGYLAQLADWADPLHYEIGLAQAGLGVLVLGYLCLEIRRHRIKIRSTQHV